MNTNAFSVLKLYYIFSVEWVTILWQKSPFDLIVVQKNQSWYRIWTFTSGFVRYCFLHYQQNISMDLVLFIRFK